MNEEYWGAKSSKAREVVLRTEGLHKSYFRGTEVPVLRGVDLQVRRGEFVSIVGSSGSGKSTLLHLLGLLDAPDAGEIFWEGKRIDDQSAGFRDRFRNQMIGFIFQFYHLLPELSVLENVMLPALIHRSVFGYLGHRAAIRRQAEVLLERVGLSHRTEHKPRELSGGEMQRVAIARALLTNPKVLLADEPTGNLDDQTGERIIELLDEIRAEIELTVVLVTHDLGIAARGNRILRLAHGRLEQNPASSLRVVGS